MKLSKELKKQILSIYKEDGIERGGYVLKNEVIECENVAQNKLEMFQFDFDVLDKLDENESDVKFLFHTHPNGNSTLSKQDFLAFINYPQFLHLILGKDGISCYKVTERETVVLEDIEEYED